MRIVSVSGGLAVGVLAAFGTMAPPSSAASPASSTAIVVMGRPGSFGRLPQLGTLSPGGPLVTTRGISGWGFGGGEALYDVVLAADGTLLMGNEPQTDNQALPTADQMVVSTFDPATSRFANVVIPTSTGATTATEPGTPVGAADVSALVAVPTNPPRVAFLSEWPYRGWNLSTLGQYPTFGYLAKGAARWAVDPSTARTAAELGASAGGSSAACPVQPSSWGNQLAYCRGPAAMAALPGSSGFVVAQYLPDETHGRWSGGLMVLDQTGHLLASYAYPNVFAHGHQLTVLPREIDVDPVLGPGGTELFAVVFDVFADGVQQPFTLQLFRWNAAQRQIGPASAPILTGQRAGAAAEYFETAHFDQEGNLWAAQSIPETISGGSIVEYGASTVSRRLTAGPCAAFPLPIATQWGTACPPDWTDAASTGQGMIRSITEDRSAHALLFVNLSGGLTIVRQAGITPGEWTAAAPIDLGLNELVDREHYELTPRNGAVDQSTQTLWLPVEQLQSATTCYPNPVPCSVPTVLDQWVYRIDLTQLLSARP
jgi:hypothetical protein